MGDKGYSLRFRLFSHLSTISTSSDKGSCSHPSSRKRDTFIREIYTFLLGRWRGQRGLLPSALSQLPLLQKNFYAAVVFWGRHILILFILNTNKLYI